MEKENSKVQKIIRQHVIGIVLITLVMTGFLIATTSMMKNQVNSEMLLLDTISKQEQYIQKLSKDANYKYALLQARMIEQLPDDLSAQLIAINQSLLQTQKEFEQFMELANKVQTSKSPFAKSGLSIQQLMADMGMLWQPFADAVSAVRTSQVLDEQTTKAFRTLNSLDQELMNYNGQVADAIWSIEQRDATTKLTSIALIWVALLITLLAMVWRFYKNNISLLRAIYHGIMRMDKGKRKKNDAIQVSDAFMPAVLEVNEAFEKLDKLIELMENMNQDNSFEGILHYIYNSFHAFIPYSHIGIALLRDQNMIEATYGISDPSLGELPKKLFGIRANLNNTSLQSVVDGGTPRVINDLPAYTKGRSSTYNRILLDAGVRSSITLPLNLNHKPIGIIFFSNTQTNAYSYQHISFLETLSNSIAISLNKNILIDELIYSSAFSLAKLAESRDEDTGDHLGRMQKYAVKITELLQEEQLFGKEITVSFVKDIGRFSPLHDIGKVAIADDIVRKKGKLTPEEYEEMKKHAMYGGRVLRAAEEQMAKSNKGMFQMGIEIAEGHHEKWNGKGYPRGKAGTAIPLSARIVAVADVFDALTSKRPYKEAYPFEVAFQMIVADSGSHFDPVIVEVFQRHKDAIWHLYNSLQPILSEQELTA